MSIAIGVIGISLFSAFFIAPFIPPKSSVEANRVSFGLAALFLIAAAIAFHG